MLEEVKKRFENNYIAREPPTKAHPTGPDNNSAAKAIPPIKPRAFEPLFTKNYFVPIFPLYIE